MDNRSSIPNEPSKRKFKELKNDGSGSTESNGRNKTSIDRLGYFHHYAQLSQKERNSLIDGFLTRTQDLTDKSNNKLKSLDASYKERHNKYLDKLNSIGKVKELLSNLIISYDNKNLENAEKYEKELMQLTEQSDYKSLRSLGEIYKHRSQLFNQLKNNSQLPIFLENKRNDSISPEERDLYNKAYNVSAMLQSKNSLMNERGINAWKKLQEEPTNTNNRNVLDKIKEAINDITASDTLHSSTPSIPLERNNSNKLIKFGEWSTTLQEVNKGLSKFISIFDQVRNRKIAPKDIDLSIHELANSGSRTLKKFVTLAENYPSQDKDARGLEDFVSTILSNNGRLPSQLSRYTFSESEKILITQWMLPFVTKGMHKDDRLKINKVFDNRTERSRERKKRNK